MNKSVAAEYAFNVAKQNQLSNNILLAITVSLSRVIFLSKMLCLHRHFQLLFIVTLICLTLGLPAINHKNDIHKQNHLIDQYDQMNGRNKKLDERIKRQLDFDLSVDHEEDIGTDITAAINANIWQSVDGKSRLDGSAKYNQHFDEFGHTGKAKIGGNIHFVHNY